MIPVQRPYLGQEELEAVGKVFDTRWLGMGSATKEFEDKLREFLGVKHVIAVNTGTSALHMALDALGLQPGDEVIVPSLTFVASVQAIVAVGARPVFCEVYNDTLNMDIQDALGRVTPRTKAIMPVHYGGLACEMDNLLSFAHERKIWIVEDAAHAFGSTCKGRKVGTLGDATCFSFDPIKNITCGEGGMLVSDDPGLLERLKRLKFHGLGVDAYDRDTQGRAPQAEVIEPGYKYNLTDFAAVLGLGQLARLEGFIARRAALAGLYRELLAGIDEITPLALPAWPQRHAWHLFIVRLEVERAGLSRDEFMARLKARNIGTGLHFKAVHLQKYYRESLALTPGALPATEWNSERILSLPLFPAMTDAEVVEVVAAIKEVLTA